MSAGETLALRTLALTRDAVRQLVLAVQEADSDAVAEAETFLIGNGPAGHGPRVIGNVRVRAVAGRPAA